MSDKPTADDTTLQAQVNDAEQVPPLDKPAKKPKPVNVGYELGLVIGELLGIPARGGDIGYALVGSGNRHKGVSAMFKAQPVTIDEFRAFHAWFKRKYPKYELKSPTTIADYIVEYRAVSQPSAPHVTTVIDTLNEITFIY